MTVSDPPDTPPIVDLVSTDIDATRELTASFFGTLVMYEPPARPAGFRFGVRGIRLGPLCVSRVTSDYPSHWIAPGVNSLYVLVMPRTGGVRMAQSGQSGEAVGGGDTAVTLSPLAPTYTTYGAGSSAVDVMIDHQAVRAELEEELGRPVRAPLALPRGLRMTGPARAFARQAHMLAAELDAAGLGPSALDRPRVRDSLGAALLTTFVHTLPHQYSDDLARPAPSPAPRQVTRVMDAVQADPAYPFTAADLARIAGVSVRTLQRGFIAYMGMPPMAYLREVRLQRAHRELQVARATDTTVTDVAYRWGFTLPSRFAGYYRDRYGVRPSDTLQG
ncbi:HTH-type transcriptional activator RhaS [Streptomyces sp. RB5]|uniref:HTH-type transcriptional activator RhaS n=1 Tax=Streptomyces smaragdinus TaxID=2585196 RepID=A0A7K0CLR5_9ACTN|nr:AraC family transcriptional regulator [Streptomyces smaragdinus]MQY14426.1 HTH-type transcriptional activator RhaS [Streptomyces smaragdinus]